MADGKASIVITAVDETKAAFDSVGRGMDRVSESAVNLNGVIARLGPLVGAATFTGMIKSAIDTADSLNDLSKRTGASVETLSGFRLAAEQSGTSLEAVANGSKKLAVSLSEHPAIFSQLGISTTNQTEAMIQLADVFAGMEDPVQRSALAVKIFGKSGDELLPMLMEGSAGLRKMIEDGQTLSPITAEMARQADQFNDQLARMKLGSENLGVTIANELLRPLNKMVEQLIEGKKIFGSFSDAMFTAGTMSPFQSWSEHAKSLREEIAKLEEDKKRFSGFGADTSAIDTSIATLKKKLEWAKYNQNQEALAGTEQLLPGGYRDEGARGMAGQSGNSGKDLLDRLNGGGIKGNKKGKADKSIDPVDVYWGKVDDKEFEDLMKRRADREREYAKAVEESNRIIYDIDPAKKKQAELDKLNKLKEQGLLTDQQVAEYYKKHYDEQAIAAEAASKRFKDNVQRNLGDVLYQGMRGNFQSIGDAFQQMLQRMAADAAAAKLTQWLFPGSGGSGGGNSGGSGNSGGFGNFISSLFNANGNAFGPVGVHAFANGGAFGNGMILDRPTPFMFANGGAFGLGVAGEAGYEGALPLKRMSSGKLGVYADGGGGKSVQITYAPTIQIDSRTDQAQVHQLVSNAVQQGNAELVDRLRREGALA